MGILRTAMWGAFWYATIGWVTRSRFGRCLLFGMLCGFIYILFSGEFYQLCFGGIGQSAENIMLGHFWIVASGACLISYTFAVSYSIRMAKAQEEADKQAEIERNRPRRWGTAIVRDEQGNVIRPLKMEEYDLDEYEAKYGAGKATQI